MSNLNAKQAYTPTQVKALIAEADHVVVLTDFDDTFGHREGTRTIVAQEAREAMHDFNKYSNNGFLVVTGKAREQVVEQMTYDHIGPVHIPAVADQFGVKLWAQTPLHAKDYVFIVNVNDENFSNGLKGIELLNSDDHTKWLNKKGLAYEGIERSDLKSCIFLVDHEANSDRYSTSAREFIESKLAPQEAEAVMQSLNFQPRATFTDVLINGFTDKSTTATILINGVLNILPKNETVLLIAAGDTTDTDGPMMEAAKGIAGVYSDRVKALNLGVGNHIMHEDYVDIGFSGSTKKSVGKLVDFFQKVVNPAMAEHAMKQSAKGPGPSLDRKLVDYFKAKQAASAANADTPSRPRQDSGVKLKVVGSNH